MFTILFKFTYEHASHTEDTGHLCAHANFRFGNFRVKIFSFCAIETKIKHYVNFNIRNLNAHEKYERNSCSLRYHVYQAIWESSISEAFVCKRQSHRPLLGTDKAEAVVNRCQHGPRATQYLVNVPCRLRCCLYSDRT